MITSVIVDDAAAAKEEEGLKIVIKFEVRRYSI